MPIAGADHLDQKFLREMENMLLEMKADIDQELHNAEGGEEQAARKSITGYDGEEEEEKFEEEFSNEESQEELEEQLEAVNEALTRIKDGTYGLCMQCETPLEMNKLRNMPEIALCSECARGN